MLNGQSAIAMVDTNIPRPGYKRCAPSLDCRRRVSGRIRLQWREGNATTPCRGLPASEFTSDLINIPVPGTGDNDHNPQRIARAVSLTRPLAKKTSSAPTATSLTST